MRRKPPPQLVTVHDHFDGSAHCVECNGPCQLQGIELFATELVRWEIEHHAICNTEPVGMLKGTLEKFGLDWKRMIGTCKECDQRRESRVNINRKSTPAPRETGARHANL